MEKRNAYRNLGRKPKGKACLEHLTVEGRIILKRILKK
jgi:hypothetical protein